MNQNREQCSSGSQDLSSKEGIASLDPRNVNFVQRVTKQRGLAGTDNCQKQVPQLRKGFWQLRRKRSIMVIEAPITFLPSVRLLAPELFTKVFTNQRMSIQLPRIMRIFSREKSCSS